MLALLGRIGDDTAFLFILPVMLMYVVGAALMVIGLWRAGDINLLLEYFSNIRPATPPQAFPELTDREREVLDLIGQGDKNADIAARLALSSKTVRNQSQIF